MTVVNHFHNRLLTQHPILRKLLVRSTIRTPVYTQVCSVHHVCVIGSGPAGFYAAQHLLKLRSTAANPLRLDIFEKLPVPFGLVRYGVAPDHPEVKNVTNTFNNVLKHPNVRFVGNIEAGKDVPLSEILNSYHAVVLCYGATSDRLIGIENESVITSAREFVGWYNGLPANENLKVNLKRATRALIIGHGNVALDIARILLTDPGTLQSTDIAPYALNELRESGVKEVVIVGRRGVLQVAFTIKEFREMMKIPGIGWDVHEGGSVGGLDDMQRPRKRLTELITKARGENRVGERNWVLKFLRSPVGVDVSEGKIQVRFQVNRMEGNKAVATDQFETIDCDVAFRSIGYIGKRVFSELPFDDQTGVIPNTNGKVADGVYCSGWAGQGPRGVILSTMQNAFEVAKLVSSDLESIGGVQKGGFDNLRVSCKVTNYSDYLKIAKVENETGRKITSVEEMLRVCTT